MSKRSIAQLKSRTDQIIKTNDNGEISAALDNSLRKDVIDSTINTVDGGMVVDSQVGYTTEFNVTDSKAFVPKKQLDDAISSIPAPDLSNYLKKDGTDAMTGNLDIDGNNVNMGGGNVNTNGGSVNLDGGNVDLAGGQLTQVSYLNLNAGGGISEDGNTNLMPLNSGRLLNDTTFDNLIGDYQKNAIVVSGNTTAVNDGVYHNVATATYTDPTPSNGKGFTVFVRNGTATVGGTPYATAGTIIIRTYHSGAWSNEVYLNKSQLDSTYVPQSRTITINGVALDLSANRSWTVGDVTTGSAASLASVAITGTAGAGFVSLISQSSNPSAVNGTIRLFANSTSNLTWVRRNNANSADIRRTLVMPDQDIDYTFPTPSSGNASTLAGLGTANSFTQTNTFSVVQQIRSVNALDSDGTTWRDTLTPSATSNILTFGAGWNQVRCANLRPSGSGVNLGSTGVGAGGRWNLIYGQFFTGSNNTAESVDFGSSTAAASAVSQSVNLLTGDTATANFNSGSILIKTGAVTGTGVRGTVGIAGSNIYLGANTAPNFQSMANGIHHANATASPSADPVGGYYQYGVSGVPTFRSSGGAVISLNRTTGWGTPTGTLTRTTFATYAGATAGVSYDQTIMKNAIDAIKINSERLAALISDLKTVNGLLST